jgi:PIN domain nuclease of toxin-antitoxin system
VTTVLLDTHILHWWSAVPEELSRAAAQAIDSADELAVASVSWFELAWLIEHGRITVGTPLVTWLLGLAEDVLTIATTPAIAATAVTLPASFPADSADRIIYATAVENGWSLITKDERLRAYRHPRQITIW